ncbi:MAG: BMP family ABC transporter substrate-binding protein [Selenomonadaceae bacterium]|nr:BMP family ABC transporter substrate-binding protein [Selenomonadaceae bacterium]
MRMMAVLVLLVFAAAVAGILLIEDSRSDTDITTKTTKVGLILNGSREDRNYCQAHYEALQSLRDELNLEIICRERVPRDCFREISGLVREEGCEIVIAVSFEFGDDMKKAAEEYPGAYFLHATGVGHRSNLSTYFGRMYQARYLAGIVAGMKSKTGTLGYVSSFPVPEVVRGINAFALGARSVRPDARVYVRYCGSWTEDTPAEDACRALLGSHPVDVVILHTNSLAPHRVAKEKGIWTIGCNLDNGEAFPDTCLTASVWNWNVYYRRQILDCLQGKFHGSHKWLSMEDGIVGLADFSRHVDEETKAAVRKADARLRSREFDVFYGPITDNTGRLRVEAGESMSDDAMLKSFDWYVEGVTVDQ